MPIKTIDVRSEGIQLLYHIIPASVERGAITLNMRIPPSLCFVFS
jgi:hypothetical protein